jgi:RNA polymerase sigma-70 factor, ECF subfamily
LPTGAAQSPRFGYRDQDVSIDNLRLASDAQLVASIGRFRHDALAEVYRRHAPAAFKRARRIVAERVLAEEVVQEVFLRLWNQPDRFDAARGSLRAYLLTQTHGRSVEVIRAEASRRTREERGARLAADSDYDLEHEVWELTQAELVRNALARLTEDERAAVELAYFGGHPYRAVAVLLGEPEGTVKSRIRSGLSRLRGALVESGIAGQGPRK